MATQHFFRYQHFQIDKEHPLGRGSYGAVYKAKCDQLPCAAKVLHPTILDPMDPGSGKIMERFQQECAFLESIRHPNIVQYLGMSIDRESRLPVLLMELLNENLTKMLEKSQQSLAYYIQVDICQDIALAIAYLHSNNIIHRDLSSNNVLIIAERRAKVTDFGMSKLAGAAPTMTPLTMCPGTLAYMAPEALDEPPRYTKKLDCFSEGVIMIQVCTRLWPEPGPRSKTVPFPQSPTGRIQMPVLEPERRKTHIDMIDSNHPLLPIAMDCLRYEEEERPSSEGLCQRLAGLKEGTEYRESVQQRQTKGIDTARLERQIGELRVRESTALQRLHELQGELHTRERANHQQLHVLQGELQHQQDLIRSKDNQLQQFELQVQTLNQKLEEQEQVTVEFQQTNHDLQREVEQLQEQLSRQPPPDTKQPQTLPQPVPVDQAVRARGRQLQKDQVRQRQPLRPSTKELDIYDWNEKGRAPTEMARGGVGAVVCGNTAYFMNWKGETYAYDSVLKRWSELPRCPFCYSSLAVVRDLVTAIGGEKNGASQNKLFIIIQDGVSTKWEEHFPAMPTKRSSTCTVSTSEHLVVAGGVLRRSIHSDKVEVMNFETLAWSTAASLPHPYSRASATICGDQLYMLGGHSKESTNTFSVFTCSLTRLMQSCDNPVHSVWNQITNSPVSYSSCATVDGELVAVGGEDAEYKTTTAVYKYSQETNSWEPISKMPTPRNLCLVAVLPFNQLMVVGGFKSFSVCCNNVEIASSYISTV